MRKITIVLSSLLVAGCSWNALYSKPSVTPVQVAFSDFKKPYPGTYLLYLSSDGLERKVVVDGVVCTAHEFTLQAARSFNESVEKTLANMVEKIKVVPAAMTKEQIRAEKARGLITITASSLPPRLLVNPGFLTKESEAKVQFSARVQVLKPRGAPFDKQLSSSDTASVLIGRCLDAHKTVKAASSKVLRRLIEQIGTVVSQSLSSGKRAG